MKKSTLISLSISVSIAVLAAGVAISAQDKYTVQVPNGRMTCLALASSAQAPFIFAGRRF